MQFSYNWIQDFFDQSLPEAETLAREVGLHMFELEGTESLDNGDVLIDWDILPNRSSDCMCYAGIAGEVSAICARALKTDYIPTQYPGQGSFTTAEHVEFSLQTDLVPRATKRFIDNVQVKQSPDWLRERLESIGQKSINNVVDITNYVMWMTGQPVHAFDYDKLDENTNGTKTIGIRHAHKDEQVTDLTGAEHTLDESMLVVCDNNKALDVAGIKGGNNSGVDEQTTRVVISACVYDFKNIRKTSRALKLRTDASARYENEVPLHKADWAQALCAQLLEQECGARAASDFIDTLDRDIELREVSVSLEQINSLLGLSLGEQEVTDLLERLAFVVSVQDSVFKVTVPQDRVDVSIAQDVIEEVGRLYGYVNLEGTPLTQGFNAPERHILYRSRDRAAHALVQLGFYETLSRTLTDSGVVELHNPLTSEAGLMRAVLLPFLEYKVQRNLAHSDTPHFFEIGKVFTGITDGTVDEHWSFAGILGRRKIKEKQKQDLFLQTKGVLETVFDVLGVRGVNWTEGQGETVAVLDINGDVLGSVGVNWWELDFSELVGAIDHSINYTKPSKYPKMDRDIAVWVPSETRVGDLMNVIEGAGVAKCIDTQLFDVFEDKENDRKSMAFRMVFQCWNETLTDEYVNTQMDKVYKTLEAHTDFEIR